MKKVIVLLFMAGLFLTGLGQTPSGDKPSFPQFNIGLGGGLDYGGFGGRFTAVATPRIQFFGAIGYNLLGVGFNGGASFRVLPQSKICPTVGAMYGYNAVIKVDGASQYNKIYYGPSFSFGVEFWGKRRPNFFNVELIIPVRSSEFHDDYNALKSNPGIEFKNEMIPVAISLGYHFTL